MNNSLLLSPPVAFLIYIPLVMLIIMGWQAAGRPRKAQPGKEQHLRLRAKKHPPSPLRRVTGRSSWSHSSLPSCTWECWCLVSGTLNGPQAIYIVGLALAWSR